MKPPWKLWIFALLHGVFCKIVGLSYLDSVWGGVFQFTTLSVAIVISLYWPQIKAWAHSNRCKEL